VDDLEEFCGQAVLVRPSNHCVPSVPRCIQKLWGLTVPWYYIQISPWFWNVLSNVRVTRFRVSNTSE